MFFDFLTMFFQLFDNVSCCKMHIWFSPIITSFPMEFYLGFNWFSHSTWLSSTIIDYLQRVAWSQVFQIQCKNFLIFFIIFFNYSCNLDACISFGSYVYIHYQIFSRFILLGFFVIFYFSSNALLFLIHNTQWFQVMFYYKGNEMKKLGYHLWQISQNVMLVLRLIASYFN